MTDRNSIALLCQELENDNTYIHEAVALCGRAEIRVASSSWNDEMDLLAMGSALHTLYNAFEGYFLRIAKYFENNVDKLAWHRDLLDRMTLEIPGIRPALISSRSFVERVDELRRFRHLFRNLYKSRLHPGKLRIVLDMARSIDADFEPMHRAFVLWLDEVAHGLDA